MPAGNETSPEVVAEFRAHYLYSGNASESARAVKLPERTGRDIARQLVNDESFAADRRLLRSAALEELIAMRTRVAQKALERFEADLEVPEVSEDAMVTVIDKRADYGKLVLDAEKNAHNLAKLEGDADEPNVGTTEVHIHLAGETDEPEKPDAGCSKA